MNTRHIVGLAALVSASANGAVLIDYDAGNAGNGRLLNDITYNSTVYPQGVLLNETLPGNIFHNSDGRSLIQYGNAGYNGGGVGSLSSISDITDNAAAQIAGFTVYQGLYSGGNNSLGFLENGTRLGATGNEAGNGDAFANAGEFWLFSDVYNVPVSASETVTISFQGGSDNGIASFSAWLIIDGANSATQVGSLQAGNAAGDPRLTYTATGLTANTSIQLVIEASTPDNSRSLIDNVFLEVVPEPSTALLGGLGLLAFLRRRR